MKELQDIVIAYEAAILAGQQMVLATVVHVEGSSYRRAGARMLVTGDGQMTGTISGGCLEGDALRKAQLTMDGQMNRLVTYDTMDEDDARIGIQLGCNGIVHILFEPVTPHRDPVALLKKVLEERRNHVIATLFNMDDKHADQPGTCLLLNEKECMDDEIRDQPFYKAVYGDAVMALKSKSAMISRYGVLHGFIEFIPPVLSLVIAGAGNDAMPLVQMAHLLGWRTTISDGRSTHATRQRFPLAGQVWVTKPENISMHIPHDERTVYVLMTHNYNYDYNMLKMLVRQECSYIGTLGPRKKLDRMLEEIAQEGITIHPQTKAHIHGPVGVDMGAETAEEIAIAILAEIRAVIGGKQAGFLKDRETPIHDQERQLIHYNKASSEQPACDIHRKQNRL